MEGCLKGKLDLKNHRRWLILISLTWGIYFTVLFSNILALKPDGLYAGHPYVWADWSLHVGMAQVFASQEPSNWFTNHPVYAGERLNYPFLTNLISGLILKVTGSIEAAFLVPSVLFAWVLCFGLYAFFFLMLESSAVSFLSMSLFFFSAGIGFFKFFRDFFGSWDFSMFVWPPKEYSRFEEFGWGSGNVLTGLLVPQRAFLLGLALAVWALVLYLYGMKQKPADRLCLLVGGLIGGLLAITHVHSLMALSIILGITGLFWIKRIKDLLWFAIPYSVVALGLHSIFLKGAVNTEKFWVWFPGWTANSVTSWLIQWSWQWGFTIPIALVGLFMLWERKNHVITALGSSFVVLFILSNMFRFQPVDWDNSKIFLWSYLGFSGLCALVIYRAWHIKRFGKVISIIIFLSISLTGIFEITRLVQTGKNSWRMISTSDMQLADEIREKAPPSARFLTAPQHDHPIMMWAARPLIMGYTSWVFNYGFPVQGREHDMRKMYQGDENLMKKYEVTYVVIDEGSKRQFNPLISYFEKFPVAFKNENRVIYDVRSVSDVH